MHIHSILSLLGAAALASAAKLTVNIPPSPPALPNPATLSSSTHAVLIGAPGVKFSAPLRRDNTFVFESIPESSYLLTIHSRDHFFAPYRVDVGHTEGEAAQEIVHVWQTFRGNEWSNKGPSLGSGQGELQIDVRPAALKDFYQARSSFSVMSIFKNPMILMGLVSVVMIFGMPKLMENSTCFGYCTCHACSTRIFANSIQWMRRRRRNSKKCRLALSAAVEALRLLRARSRTLIWPDFCQGNRALRRVRRSEFACKRRNTRIHAKDQTIQSLPSIHISVDSTQPQATMFKLPVQEMPTYRNTFSLDIRLRLPESTSAVLSASDHLCLFPSAHLA
jgi:hypothetical protein